MFFLSPIRTYIFVEGQGDQSQLFWICDFFILKIKLSRLKLVRITETMSLQYKFNMKDNVQFHLFLTLRF